MLTTEVRKLLLVSSITLGCGAVIAYLKGHEFLCSSLQIFACNCFGFWAGLMMIGKARALDGFVALTNGLDAFYADPNQSDLNKQLIANYATDHLDAHINRLKTANPLKDEQ